MELNNIYSWYERTYPYIVNDFLDTTKDIQEALIICKCGAGKRIFINNTQDIYENKYDIKCANCGRELKDCLSISTHSGGIFNATSIWDMEE